MAASVTPTSANTMLSPGSSISKFAKPHWAPRTYEQGRQSKELHTLRLIIRTSRLPLIISLSLESSYRLPTRDPLTSLSLILELGLPIHCSSSCLPVPIFARYLKPFLSSYPRSLVLAKESSALRPSSHRSPPPPHQISNDLFNRSLPVVSQITQWQKRSVVATPVWPTSIVVLNMRSAKAKLISPSVSHKCASPSAILPSMLQVHIIRTPPMTY